MNTKSKEGLTRWIRNGLDHAPYAAEPFTQEIADLHEVTVEELEEMRSRVLRDLGTHQRPDGRWGYPGMNRDCRLKSPLPHG